MVSYLGKGLNVIISCDHLPGHNWMSFLCWYSLSRNLPDAKVHIVCSRQNVSGTLFLWTRKVRVPFKMYNLSKQKELFESFPRPNLIVPPYCVAVRDFEESMCDYSFLNQHTSLPIEETNLICDVRDDKYCPFYSYKNGWGNFILEEWINKAECPLSRLVLSRLTKQGMSLNEKKNETIWKESLNLFQNILGESIYEEI